MNITTIIELDNQEVEEIVGAKFAFIQEHTQENIVLTCVENFVDEKTGDKVEIEEAMDKLFFMLKEKELIAKEVEEYSYELPSCERIKKNDNTDEDLPQKVTISYTFSK